MIIKCKIKSINTLNFLMYNLKLLTVGKESRSIFLSLNRFIPMFNGDIS